MSAFYLHDKCRGEGSVAKETALTAGCERMCITNYTSVSIDHEQNAPCLVDFLFMLNLYENMNVSKTCGLEM